MPDETCRTCRAFAATDVDGKQISRCYSEAMFEGKSQKDKKVISKPESEHCGRYQRYDTDEILLTKYCIESRTQIMPNETLPETA